MPEQYKRNSNTKCTICGKDIYRRPIELKRNKGRAFCSSLCYGVSNRKEAPCVVCGKMILAHFNKKTCSRSCSNIHRTGIKYKVNSPKDKVKTQQAIKSRLLEARGVCCERCGYGRTEILQVHHKNRDRGNNDMDNLELICPNCHYEDHFLSGKKMSKK